MRLRFLRRNQVATTGQAGKDSKGGSPSVLAKALELEGRIGRNRRGATFILADQITIKRGRAVWQLNCYRLSYAYNSNPYLGPGCFYRNPPGDCWWVGG